MSKLSPRNPKRHADRTRNALIHAAFEEIWQFGFQAASLDAILERARLTKGALYHHFPNKQALGYAVVDEYIRYLIHHDFLRPLDLEAEEEEAAGSAVFARDTTLVRLRPIMMRSCQMRSSILVLSRCTWKEREQGSARKTR